MSLLSAQARAASPEKAFRAYYDASLFRADAWNQLKLETTRLARASADDNTEELRETIDRTLGVLEKVERYWAFPGHKTCSELRRAFDRGFMAALAGRTTRIARLLESDGYRRRAVSEIVREIEETETGTRADGSEDGGANAETRPYFEVLVIDNISRNEEDEVRESLLAMRRDEDEFIYDVVVAPTCEDALIAVLFNHNIQSCVLRYSFPKRSSMDLPELRRYLDLVDDDVLEALDQPDPSLLLGAALKDLRPELDLFIVTDDRIENIAGRTNGIFRRVFYRQEDYLELHLSILKGIDDRFDAPFFTALTEYAKKPTGVFHALPISRGKSIWKSHWIRDMGDFYGPNIFMAETSSTTGGLDSLLQPTGPLKSAQEKLARAYGAKHSYFVTNGTSTANKIVMQALCRPGDIVLVSHDCHKSHHYALVLAGAFPVYMDAYPLQEYSISGGVSLRTIKHRLLELKAAGKLDKVRMLLLTNCTFDGIVYHPEMVMREVLAIKPDMIFVWDEAWYAFARFVPTYRRRSGMEAAETLRDELRDPEYCARYEAWKKEFDQLDPDDPATWLDRRLLPDPARARVRVYATQSTHKTLTSLRQGSAIHVYDQDFARQAHDAFEEAYMTHTSTSPNYQILASLDVGRRQVELEGYELVKKSVELAMTLRERIEEQPLLRKYFRLLRVKDLVPAEYRSSGLEQYYSKESGFLGMSASWREDEFALDPLRVTVHVGATGIEGDAVRKMLIERFDIQINKTSRNTVLFMLNIGSSRGAIAYLLEVLMQIACEIEEDVEEHSPMEQSIFEGSVELLTERLPPLPEFSHFHPKFRPDPASGTPEGDLRKAFFLAYDSNACEYLHTDGSIAKAMADGQEVVSASFVTPYPPGYPILVPGQVISEQILAYLKALDVKEIHGYNPTFGLRVFRQDVIDNL
ncbi:MAG: aminotransferase class I/II-fold pyridoxal phosphate-dependent enzyme [Acidobacteria bacterium]|nr:aminotransferase class I/II-fold pyridoxal phosphate-dependent enzyme [Acidobacteriota bacterium]